MSQPLVTVVVPARNEAKAIEGCLAAVAAQDYPAERLEVLVVNGGSSDATAPLARAALAGAAVHRADVIDNPAATTPSNLNRGLAEAGGTVLCRVDARSRIPPHYVSRCVALLESRPEVAVVGGAQVALPPDPTATGRGIARALNNRWGMGFARYRRGASSGPSDTVYLGAFRTAELRQVGGWDERFGTNQDFELNRRMSSLGAVWFESGLEVGYLPRPTMAQLFSQYRRFGTAKVRYWRTTGDPPRARQLVLLAAPVAATGVGLVALLVPSARRLMLPVGLALPVVVEMSGNRDPATRPADHAVAAVALGAVAGGWLAGVWSEFLRGRGG